MNYEDYVIARQRQEYAEASEAKRGYLERRRTGLIEVSGGALPPRTWGGPKDDPLWPEAERSAQSKRSA